MGISTVHELETRIREIFNITRRHKKTRADKAAFYQACSAMDAIGDTEIALQEFINTKLSFDLGIRYLLAYGFLQATFLQQDAIKHLALSLNIPFSLPVELRDIRDLRNDAVGHPTNRDADKNRKIKSFHHISRVTLSNDGFKLFSYYSDNTNYKSRDVRYKDILEIQSRFSEKLLLGILDALRNDENTHRDRFMSDQLLDIFHPSLSYLFQKVDEGIRNDQHHLDLALPAFESIMTMISSFEAKLIQRNEEEIIKCVMENLAYPTDKVRRYLNGDRNIDMHAADIYIQYIENEVDKLKKIASEIDQEYEKRI